MDLCCLIDTSDAIDAILHKGFGEPVAKAIDPLDPKGFLRIVARLSKALRGATGDEEAKAMKRALKALDVDWKNLTARQREAAVKAAQLSIGAVPARVMPKVKEAFTVVGPKVVGESRASSIRKFGFSIDVSMSQRDLAAEKWVRANTNNFITDEYGVRRDELGQLARDIVASGLEMGLGSDDISAELDRQLGDRVMRGPAYWQVVAMSFVNQARTYSQLNSYSDAGIQRFTFEAILDEVTTDQCRFYHGKSFSVAGAQGVMNKVLGAKDPSAVKELNPWVRIGKDDEGRRILYVGQGEGKTVLATVARSGMGAKDDTGEYENAVSTKKLEEVGCPFPPLHGHCRSTTVPEVT